MPKTISSKDKSPRQRRVSVMGYKRRKYNGNGRVKQIVDIIVFKDPHDPNFYEHKCWFCKRVFWANNKHIRLCTDSCRTHHYNHSEYKGGQWMSGSGYSTERETPSNWLQDILGEEL